VNKVKKAYMNIKTSNSIISKICEDIKPFFITITGGEPFLNMSVLKNFISKIPLNMSIGINTNLTHTTPENLETLLGLNNTFGLLASLPHFEKEKYEFITKSKDINDFYTNLLNIKENTNIPITINMVISKYNLNSIYDQGKFLFEKFSIDSFAATPVSNPPLEYQKEYDYTLAEEDITLVFNQLIKLNKEFGIKIDSIQTIPLCFIPEEIRINNFNLFKRPCNTGKSTLAIDYKGNVRSCIQSPYNIGNILESDFEALWRDFEDFRQNKNLPEDCIECDALVLCNGGCRFNGYNLGEPLNRKDPRMKEKIKLDIKKVVQKEAGFNNKYILNKSTKYRKETEEFYTFINSDYNLLFVNENFKNFIVKLEGLGSFNPKILLKHYSDNNVKDKLKKLFDKLISKNFLKPYV